MSRVLVGLLLVFTACSPKLPPPTTATGSPAGEVGVYGTGGATTDPNSTRGSGGTAGTLPWTTSSGVACQELDAMQAAAAAEALRPVANAYVVAGAQPLAGTAMAGHCTSGQSLQTEFTMQPGKCYTVVASALPNGGELRAHLEVAPGANLPSPVIAEDKLEGPTAVVAPAPNCFKWILPMPGAVRAVVDSQGGPAVVVAQIYQK